MIHTEDLIKQLASASVQDRIRAAEILGQLGPEAKAAIPVLVDRFRCAHDREESETIILALFRIDTQAVAAARCARGIHQNMRSAREWARGVGESQARVKLRNLLWASEGDNLD